MALYQHIQRVLLIGMRLPSTPPGVQPPAPPALAQLAQAIAPAHQRFDAHAVHAGNRYRSAFWAIYLLSALAIFCAVVPLVFILGGGAEDHLMAVAWGVAELLIIGVVGLLVAAGNRSDWHGRWLEARTRAEMAWYLPMIAPLVPFEAGTAPVDENWYARAFGSEGPALAAREIAALCAEVSPLASRLLREAWTDPQFVSAYAAWAAGILRGQRAYHDAVRARQRALIARVGRINATLFAATALGAAAHLFVHSPWLLFLTIFFPALGASLHGALAQSEAYRLALSSDRLAGELESAIARIEACVRPSSHSSELAQSEAAAAELPEAIGAAIGLVLDEHHAWHALVRPHHLPLG